MSVKVAKVSPFQHFLYVLIGSIPMIITTMIMSYILYADYARNNYSFFRKDLYISNIEKTSYEKNDLDCGRDYKLDSACSSQVCFRYFSDFLVNDEDSKTLLKVAKTGFSHGESDASSSILDISSKTITKGKSVVALPREKYFTNEAEFLVFKKVKDTALEVLAKTYNVKNVYPTKPVYFQKLVKREFKEDNYFDIVVDKAIRPSCQYTAVFQLSTYILDFNGARFNFLDNNTMTSIQPKLGRLMIYSSGSENQHQTEKMDYGEYYSLYIPFTCDKSLALADQDF